MNRPFSGQDGNYIFRLLALLKKVGSVFLDRDTPKSAKAIIIIALAYALFPADFIPEWIPILGVMDDLSVAVLLIGLALRFVPDEIKQKHGLK